MKEEYKDYFKFFKDEFFENLHPSNLVRIKRGFDRAEKEAEIKYLKSKIINLKK